MNKIIKVLFNKKTLSAMLLVLQMLIFYLCFYALREYSLYLYGGINFLSFVLMVYLINRNDDSGIKLIWIVLFALLPVFGMCLYLFVRMDYPSKWIQNRMKVIHEKTAYLNNEDDFQLEQMRVSKDDETNIFHYLHTQAYSPVYKNTYSEYFTLGDHAFPRMIEEIKKATSFIFIEYFIVNEESRMWKTMLRTLREKVHEGVEVKIIFDGMGSALYTSSNICDKLKKYGIDCRIFSPVKPFLSTYQNNRDHRKMLVIDGKTAFSGGINIADEYINERNLYGHWKDNSVMLKGDAVKSFTVMFLRMWSAITKEEVKYENYVYERNLEYCTVDDGYISPFSDSPMAENRVAKTVYISILNNAKDYVYITTPYLILDEEMRSALKFAAKRGVDVRILMPRKPDKWYAFALARTHYPELLKAGVKIYEYSYGFVHSKTLVSDDIRATVGTSNFDYRSLYLHYECGVYFYKSSIVDEVKDDFLKTIERSKFFKIEDYNASSLFMRIVGRILRPFAPLM